MNCINTLITPQLKKIHSGKVRESFRVDDVTRMVLTTDRISAFDKILDSCIPFKGAILNRLSNFWFEKTKHIVGNHLVSEVDPNISLVREAVPIRVEVIVRGYITGSMWRLYEKGKRVFSGINLPDGLKKNEKFDEPLVTPTTKEDSDEEITPSEIASRGLASSSLYEEMERIAKALYKFGNKLVENHGLILVDTKYEFGLIDNKLVLIDEIHTPDSSRYMYLESYKREPQNVESIDKEFVRGWLLKNGKDGLLPLTLPDDVIDETKRRYLEIYGRITGQSLDLKCEDVKHRICLNLIKSGVIKDGYVALVMGSTSDLEFCEKIKEIIEQFDIMVDMRVVSAHKNGEEIVKMANEYNNSIEPGAIIAVAGMSNGLGGALASNLAIPVISCPPFKDRTDMLININSSLMMPSKVPAMTVVGYEQAVLAAMRCLNIPRLKNVFMRQISEMKDALKEADFDIRTRGRLS